MIAIINREVPTAVLKVNPVSNTSAGMIRNPPPAPTNPVRNPIRIPSRITKHGSEALFIIPNFLSSFDHRNGSQYHKDGKNAQQQQSFCEDERIRLYNNIRDDLNYPFACQKDGQNGRNSKQQSRPYIDEMFLVLWNCSNEAGNSNNKKRIGRRQDNIHVKKINQNWDGKNGSAASKDAQYKADTNRCYIPNNFHAANLVE